MKAFFLALFLLMPLFSPPTFASEECEACMAECPHRTREARACDKGCPQVCSSRQRAEIKKVKTCADCLAECPHNSREFRSCDGGCKKECGRDELYSLFKKARSESAACLATQEKAAP